MGLCAGSSIRLAPAVAEEIVSDSSGIAGCGDGAEDEESEVVVGAEISWEIEEFGKVEVAGRSDAGRVCRSRGASSARTKTAAVPLKLAQRTSANQAPRRDLLMRLCRLCVGKRQYLLSVSTLQVVDRGGNKGLCSKVGAVRYVGRKRFPWSSAISISVRRDSLMS